MSEADELPEGWAKANVPDLLAEPMANGRSVPDGDGFPVLRLTALRNGRIDLRERKLGAWSKKDGERFAVRQGDFLVARGNGSLSLVGRGAMVMEEPDPVAYPDTTIRLRPRKDVFLPGYLRAVWDALETRHQIEAAAHTTAGIHKVSQQDLAAIELPVPPLPEQHRIVEHVEALLAQVNKAKDRLDRVKLILKRFRQAVLAAACSGKLTEEWRSEHPELDPALRTVERLKSLHEPFGTDKRGNAAPPDDEAHDLDASVLPSTWICTELLWLCEPGRPITYGILKPGPNQDGGVPYVRVADFPAGVIKVAGVHRTTKKIAEAYKRSTLRTGDVLLSIRGTYGRICVVPPELNGANITQDTARLTIHESVNAAYIVMYLRSQPVQNRMKRAAKGVAVHGVNIGDVRALQVALPPLEEQVEIVRRVDALLTVADVIEARLATASSRAGKLPQAILSKAFKGELVPTEAELARAEGRSFESAAEMLKRVTSTRGEHEGKRVPRGRPGSTPGVTR